MKGITEVSASDIRQATESGYAVKLLARAQRVTVDGQEQIALGVEPTLVPKSHPLAGITGPYNAIVLETEFAGRLMFYGAGAGGAPTASAVLSDVVAGANHLVSGGHAPRESVYADLPICEPGRVETCRQIRLQVADRIGMLAEIAKIYAAGEVSIASLTQPPTETVPDEATLVISTHLAQNSKHDGITAALAKSPLVHKIASEMSIEEDQ